MNDPKLSIQDIACAACHSVAFEAALLEEIAKAEPSFAHLDWSRVMELYSQIRGAAGADNRALLEEMR